MWADIVFIIGAYAFGSIPHLQLLGRLRRVKLNGDYHQDLWYRGGKLLGVAGVAGEFVKGALPVLAGIWMGFDIATIAIGGAAAVCGQMWPVFLKFDGEKGNSIALAMAMALVPKAMLVAVAPVIAALLIRTVPRLLARARSSGNEPVVGGSYSRTLPLGMLICFLVLPFTSWYFGEPAIVFWCLVALFVLILIRRVTAGLRTDLAAGADIGGVVIKRLLYDRSTAIWRE
jgi:glycerol-3-phosphate acyltransferase PlsY